MNINEMTEDYHQQLLDHDDGLAYYMDRGINEQTIARYKLGWLVEPVVSNHEDYHDMPVVPYLTAAEQAVILRASPFESDASGRYDLIMLEQVFPLKSHILHLFNVGNAMPGLRTNKVHLVQDVESVLVLRSRGKRAVAVPGWENWNPSWVHLFLHSNVEIHHDNTKPDMVKSITNQFKQYRVPFTESTMPAGQTVASQEMTS